MLKVFYWKNLKIYKACIKEKIILYQTLSKLVPQKLYFQKLLI